jgi:predicted RNase H-like nuclease (RuvC/YqgF family)
MDDAMGDEMPADDDLNLEEILRELEMPADEEDDYSADASVTEGEEHESNEDEDEEDINEIIEAILRETDMGMEPPVGKEEDMSALKTENEELEKNLEEAYRTVKHLNSVINEVNLLNAKLLYTNKLFRNFDLNEGQKMKVIENFDRAVSPREAKLVFATLAESFTKPTQKRAMVKESAASRPTRTTAPSKETTQILSEGFEMANRWKKLAGLI